MYGCVFHKENGFCEKFSDDRCKSYCVMGPCQYAIPSHADRIRAMSDEELATFFGTLPCCPPGSAEELCFPENTCGAGTKMMVKCWANWLKAPVEPEEKDG